LIGVVVGVLVGWLLDAFGMAIVFSVPVMVAAFVCAAGIGLLFGFAPALKAARLGDINKAITS
jgi:macrolide transport system ATP-binding/permease protein